MTEDPMAYAKAMLDTHPDPPGGGSGVDPAAIARCAEACAECAQLSTMCADACLGEPTALEMRSCIRSDLDCADVCAATARVVARQTAFDTAVVRTLVAACAEICGASAEECERHAAHHAHCRICGEATRRCQQACEQLMLALA
ncbi:four-helix bundle copper-binding protein [Conexibacter sp. CPCC 206217]|uniref:four-helix bundle copper-binding protein n=1 Tax=Conexibacter sp. CPCC 206217 TaxID=3064574 RepID=UPI0027217BA5|nr:four-helix bundle copper-binding protein [Conexibacter sp. CPCC 206217]MDO8209073.1 four-helix bundle copper-binding protein [Conexibacter sp. CPCC 206217]